MRIVIIEKDPFVRTDLSQALCALLPTHTIATHATADDVARDMPAALVLWDAVDTDRAMLAHFQHAGAAIFSTNDEAAQLLGGVRYIQRPFTETTLLQALGPVIKMEQSD